MTRAVSRPFLVAVAAVLTVAVCRVDSAPGPTPPPGGYTWRSALEEAHVELGATMTGVRRELLEAKATALTVWGNIETVRDTLHQLPAAH